MQIALFYLSASRSFCDHLIDKLLQMFGALQVFNHALHCVILDDLIQHLFVHVSVVDCHGDTFLAEPTSSSDPVKISFRVSLDSVEDLMLRDVIINYKFNLWHINTSCDQVGSNKYIDLLISELLHGLIPLFV